MKRKAAFTFLMIAIFFISGCEKKDSGEAFDCVIGNTYNVTSNLSFTIDSINDSRCPEGAMCFWAGDVYVYLDIYHNNTLIDTSVYLKNTARNPINLENYSFKVLEVTPISLGTTKSKYITIKMVVTKN
jgi:hypothetical protein